MDWFCGGEKLLDWNATLSSPYPLFSNCFDGLVFRMTPLFFLWLFVGPYILYTIHGKPNDVKYSKLYAVKQFISLLLCSLSTSELIYVLIASDNPPPVDYITPLEIATSMMLTFGMMRYDKSKGVPSSGLLTIFWCLTAAFWAFPCYSRSSSLQWTSSNLELFKAITFFISYILVLTQLVLSYFVDFTTKHKQIKSNEEEISLKEEGEVPIVREPCPESQSSFLSQMSFSWFTGLAHLGNKRPLVEDDLWELNPPDQTETVVKTFLKNWNSESERCESCNIKVEKKDADKDNGPAEVFIKSSSDSKCKVPSLHKTLIKTFGPYFCFSVVLKIFQDLLAFTSPQILKALITYTRSDLPAWQGYFLAISLFAIGSIQTVFLQQYFHCCFIVGLRIRSAIIGAVYRKAIKLSNSAKKKSTVGEIVNLMSVDAQRLLDLISYLNIIWSGPLQIILAIYFLWAILGPSVLAGVAVMILLIPINGCIASRLRKIQIKQMGYKDQRIKMMNELLNGMKALKMYAWEMKFKEKISEIRVKELEQLKKAALLNAISAFNFICAPFIVSLATFSVYVLIDSRNILDAEKTFVSLSLFHIMRFPLMMLPNTITNLVQASVSIKRLSSFLCNEEIKPGNVSDVIPAEQSSDDVVISVKEASFKWSWSDPKEALRNISLEVKRGSLVAVVGKVGSGKSSLISALLGDIEKVDGFVGVQGSTAYVAQQSWIQNRTVRGNILFGSSASSYNYDDVIANCQLTADLDLLPAGDLTEIGERGINLSGGQKQRVAIARAVYQDCDIYLFDDPLSAVDSHVGRRIFDDVIGPDGCLKNKTRILVTHGINYLPQADTIIVLEDGSISEVGSYDHLISQNGAFSDFIRNFTFTDEDSSIPDPDKKRSKINMSKSRTNRKKVVDNKSVETEPDSSKLKQKSDQNEPKKSKIYEEEKSETGNVSWKIYLTYMKAIGYFFSFLIIAFYILQNAALVWSNIWLAEWSEDPVNVNGTRDGTLMRLGIYGVLGLAQSIFALGSAVLLFTSAITASGIIHDTMINRLMHSPLQFFDVTPVGRIINRCGKDTDVMDDLLIRSASQVLSCGCRVAATVFVIIWATYYFAIALVPISILYYFIQKFYVNISRQLKRIQSVSQSPIFSHFAETLTGTSTIRAYSRQNSFIKQNEDNVDTNQMAYYPTIVSNRWLAFRLEMMAKLTILLTAIFAVAERGSVDAGVVGLSLSYALQITQTFNWMVRQVSEMESNIVALERIHEYTGVEQEASHVTDKKLPDEWPHDGAIEFCNYSTRYRPELPFVIKNINFKIRGGEKIGIVGRTGAGKSSLTLALFRIVEAVEGDVTIDDVIIGAIGLKDLRSKLAIIPQEPVLFSGSLRFNLDPFSTATDDELWQVLRQSHLDKFVSSLPDKLEHTISEGGDNLSVGQRQLVCLARALLRNSKILVLDEATAAVDLETDDLIQNTIRESFKEATTFTIAHRLNTIMDSNRIIVLDQGSVVQIGTPDELIAKREGIFFEMANDAGLI